MKTSFFLLILFYGTRLFGQPPVTITYYDESWNKTKQKKAHYLIEETRVSDTCWLFRSYSIHGPMIRSVTFKDKNATIKSGPYKVYKPNGRVDTSGNFYNGFADGRWIVNASNGRYLAVIEYRNGRIMSRQDSTQYQAELRARAKADSIGHANELSGKRDGSVPGNSFTAVEVESEFPGGQAAWNTYIGTNLAYPKDGLKYEIEGIVEIDFVIDRNGNITDPQISKSVEYSLDREAMRIIIQSPKWEPAVQYGRKVKSYKKQPFQFKLT